MRSSLRYTALAVVILALGAIAGPARGQSGGINVAVIDVAYVFKHHGKFQHGLDQIKQDIDQFRTWLSQEQQRLRTEAEKLNQYKPGSPEYKAQEEKLAQENMSIKLEAAKKQKEFMEREAKEYAAAYTEIRAFVAQCAVHNNISLVLRYSAEEMDPMKRESIMQAISQDVVYQNRLNITPMIVDAIAEKYPEYPPTGPDAEVAIPIGGSPSR